MPPDDGLHTAANQHDSHREINFANRNKFPPTGVYGFSLPLRSGQLSHHSICRPESGGRVLSITDA